jgi:hypothetical protein
MNPSGSSTSVLTPLPVPSSASCLVAVTSPVPLPDVAVDDESAVSGAAAYRWLLRQPGSRPAMTAGLVARLPVSMIGVGGLLMVAAATGSYRLAGLTTAAIALAGAGAGPAVGRRIDRAGARAVLPPLAAAHVCAGIAFVLAALLGAPVPVLVLAAVATGATLPQVGPVVRQRWATLLAGDPRLDTAYTLESALDEVSFVTGPGLASALAGLTPSAGVAAALLLAAVGAGTFSALPAVGFPRSGVSPAGPDRATRRPAGRERPVPWIPGMTPLLASAAALGMFFGATDVALIAYGRGHGWGGAAGLLPSTLTAANLCAGLVYGMVRFRASLTQRFAVAACLFAVATVAAPLVVSLGAGELLVVGVVLAGLPLTPVIISSTAIVGELVPAHRRTEGFGWTVIANSVGVSAGAPLAGVLVDQVGATGALVVFPACGCALGAAALLAAWRLTVHRRRGARAERDDGGALAG